MSTTLAGYFLGTLIPNIQDQIHLVIAIVIFLSLLPGIIKFLSEWRRKARSNA
jgi:membrane protein DedA with SNARE-associated domain